MRAITPVFSVLLIIILSVALVGFFWMFVTGTFNTLRLSGTSTVNESLTTISSCMKIESVSGNQVSIRNCGEGSITQGILSAYLDDIPLNVTMSPAVINEDETGTVIMSGLWNFNLGGHTLRIINPRVVTEAPVNAVLPDSTVLDLEFDEGSGNIAHDLSGNGNDGTLINGPIWTDGKFGKALQFDGIGDYVGVNDAQSIRLGEIIQVDAWIKTSFIGTSSMAIADRYTGSLGSESGWLLFLTDQGKLTFHIGGSGGIAEAIGYTDLRDGNWHYVIGSYNGPAVKVFVDGNKQGEVTYSGSIWNDPAQSDMYGLYIGMRADCGCGGDISSYFNGMIDGLKIYSETDYPFKEYYLRLNNYE